LVFTGASGRGAVEGLARAVSRRRILPQPARDENGQAAVDSRDTLPPADATHAGENSRPLIGRRFPRAREDVRKDDARADDGAFIYSVWSRGHALAALAGCGTAAVVGQVWPLSLAGLLSIAVLMRLGWGAFTPDGAFGWANRVTAFRLGLVLVLGVLGHGTPGWALAALVVVASALDVADGAIARRYGLASPFGAAFDIETDALMTLVIDLQLWQRGRLGAWILIPGLLRYAYVLTLAVFPPPAGHVRSSRFARLAFAALIAGSLAALVCDHVAATALAGAGTVAVMISFARSFRWSYRLAL
jgi:phosphatidylglycerophosphate synthase